MQTRASITASGDTTRRAPVHLAVLGVALVVGALVTWPAGELPFATAFARAKPAPPPDAEPALFEPAFEDLLAHQGEHDRRVAREANLVLDEILGAGQARVSVRSTWDFARHTLKSEKPGRRVVLHESRTVAEAPAADGAPSVSEEKDYSAAHSSEERVHSTPRLERLSVALFLDQGAPDSPELRAAIQAAVGFDEGRGDEFRTVVLPFARPRAAPAPAGVVQPADPLGLIRWSLPLGGVALVFLWLASRKRRRAPPARASEVPPAPPEPAHTAQTRLGAVLAADPARVGAVLSRWAREEPSESAR